MARKNLESSKGLNATTVIGGGKNSHCNPISSSKFSSSSPKYFKSITPPMKQQHHYVMGDLSPQRLSPSSVRVSTPPSAAAAAVGSNPSSPRTSPGLIAGHYAGCKFTEPPLPSALPPPPQHWMQSPHHTHVVLRHFNTKQEPEQLAQQLKVLLKVQA